MFAHCRSKYLVFMSVYTYIIIRCTHLIICNHGVPRHGNPNCGKSMAAGLSSTFHRLRHHCLLSCILWNDDRSLRLRKLNSHDAFFCSFVRVLPWFEHEEVCTGEGTHGRDYVSPSTMRMRGECFWTRHFICNSRERRSNPRE